MSKITTKFETSTKTSWSFSLATLVWIIIASIAVRYVNGHIIKFNIVTAIFMQEIILIVPLIYCLVKKQTNFEEIGLYKFDAIKSCKLVAKGFGIFLIINFTVNLIQSYFEVQIPGFGQQIPVLPIFGSSIFGLIIAVSTISIIAPLVEELLFRGLIYKKLSISNKNSVATLGSALIFGVSHFELSVIIPITILGCILAWMYKKSGSIWTPILFHMVNNTIALIIELRT